VLRDSEIRVRGGDDMGTTVLTGSASGACYAGGAQPRLVIVSITRFWQTWPYRDFRGSDLIAQALGGMVYVNGFEHEPPLQSVGLQGKVTRAAAPAVPTSRTGTRR
jgi:hypothetical protein